VRILEKIGLFKQQILSSKNLLPEVDLFPEIVKVNLPQTPAPGDTGSVVVRLTNQGTSGVSDPITVRLIASTDAKIDLDAGGNLINDAVLKTWTINRNLDPGQSTTIRLDFNQIVVGPPGAFNYIVQVDPNNAIVESNENNNIDTKFLSGRGTNVAVDWSSTFLNAIQAIPGDTTNPDSTPPNHARNSGIFHSAIYDAARLTSQSGQNFSSIFVSDFEFERFLARNPQINPNNASIDAAISQAAFTVLTELYPQETATYRAQLRRSLSEVPDGRFEDNGRAIGKFVARQILRERRNDGAAQAQFQIPNLPDPTSTAYEWRPDPESGEVTGLLPGFGRVDPFAIDNVSNFLPGPAPAFNTAQYAAEIEEVRQLGGLANTAVTTITRTQEQTNIAAFWLNDRTDTSGPPGQWTQLALELAVQDNLSVFETSRLLGQLGVALADAAIVTWDAKYDPVTFQGVPQPRPNTVINLITANDAFSSTVGDPDWQPLFENPNFPDYISGHAAFGGAAASVLESFFGVNRSFIATSQEVPGVVRSFNNFQEAAIENTLSRVYAGVHVRSSGVLGQQVGDAVGDFVALNIATEIV